MPTKKYPDAIEGAELPDFDPARLYDVQLHTPIQLGHVTFAPGAAQTLTGQVCLDNRDKLWKAVLNDSGVQELAGGVSVGADL